MKPSFGSRCVFSVRPVPFQKVSFAYNTYKEIILSFLSQADFLFDLLAFLVDGVLILFELEIVLHDVDVRRFEETAHFAHVGGPDLGVGVEPGHRLGETDQRLKLPHCVSV